MWSTKMLLTRLPSSTIELGTTFPQPLQRYCPRATRASFLTSWIGAHLLQIRRRLPLIKDRKRASVHCPEQRVFSPLGRPPLFTLDIFPLILFVTNNAQERKQERRAENNFKGFLQPTSTYCCLELKSFPCHVRCHDYWCQVVR